MQVPHWRAAPQPSPAGPQVMFWVAQVIGVQLPPSGQPQVPEAAAAAARLRRRAGAAHDLVAAAVAGRAARDPLVVAGVRRALRPPSGYPHWPATPPPPQIAGGVQVPQLREPPQPSPAVPQLMLCWAQVTGTQVPPSGMPH